MWIAAIVLSELKPCEVEMRIGLWGRLCVCPIFGFRLVVAPFIGGVLGGLQGAINYTKTGELVYVGALSKRACEHG